MARGPTARVVLNRAAVDQVMLGSIDGLFELTVTIIEDAATRAPDSPYDPYPTGEGLPKQGAALAYAKGGKVAGWSQRGKQPSKPRAVKPKDNGFVVIGGFGFPAHLAEGGTIRQPAQPFLTPTLMDHLPEAGPAIARGVAARIASAPARAAEGAAIKARIAASRGASE
jgi:hypothetical protein